MKQIQKTQLEEILDSYQIKDLRNAPKEDARSLLQELGNTGGVQLSSKKTTLSNFALNLLSQEVDWISQLDTFAITGLDNFIDNGREFGNAWNPEKSVWFYWVEQRREFFVIDQGTEFWNPHEKANTAKKADWNTDRCGWVGMDHLSYFDYHRFFDIMDENQREGTLLFLSDLGPNSDLPAIADKLCDLCVLYSGEVVEFGQERQRQYGNSERQRLLYRMFNRDNCQDTPYKKEISLSELHGFSLRESDVLIEVYNLQDLEIEPYLTLHTLTDKYESIVERLQNEEFTTEQHYETVTQIPCSVIKVTKQDGKKETYVTKTLPESMSDQQLLDRLKDYT